MMTIGERIHARRRALGWTLGELGERAELSAARVSRVERGADVPLSTLERILDALGMRLTVEVCDEVV